MIVAAKILFLIVLLLVLSYPFLPFSSKAKRFSTFSSLRYNPPFNKRNFIFIPITIAEFIVVALIFEIIAGICDKFGSLPFVSTIISAVEAKLGVQGGFFVFAVRVLLINIAILYAFIFVKGILRHVFIDPIFGWGKNGKMTRKERKALAEKRKLEKKKRKEAKKRGEKYVAEEPAPEPVKTDDGEEDPENGHIMRFPHLEGDEEKDESKKRSGETEKESSSETDGIPKEEEPPAPPKSEIMRAILGIFFEAPDYLYARPSVARATAVLQTFLYIVEAIYILLFVNMAAMLVFAMPEWMYRVAQIIRSFYIYPFISVIFLQEICNFLRTKQPVEKPEELMQKEEEETKKECEARLVALNNELTKRFDENHFFRYYPELPCKEVPEYVCSNIPYASALAYIREYARQNSGHVVQSYMESLDAVFNDNHIYFGTSFYSEYGEYLISYAYTRLLSGARMIFIISDMEKAESLRRYIRDRLTSMTNCSNNATWRVYIKGERLDQADILIATPEDFRDDSIINHYPAFFEEVCNAVFVDADRITAIYGYLCPILSMRLKKATENRIRFIFLTRDIMRGFAAKSLPRYFCIDKVYTCSSALENESTAYTLLNRESKHHRIYNKHGQTLTSLECIVAEQAVKFGVDGVKVISGAPIDHADAVSLATKGVELNEFYKPVPKINYMIYADDRCNLASAIYTCTRFRGHVKSIANIISKPYLLRDYFVFMASNGEYINRSSFIQPRAVESMDIGKLSLLRIFCEASMDDGMSLAKFCEKMRNIIEMVGNRFSSAPSCFCGDMIEKIKSGELVPDEDDYAAYLVSGLFDYTGTGKDRSEGKKAKDYYLIVDSKYSTSASRDKTICFKRSKYFFDRLTDKNKRVELRLNDSTIGYLDTFPSRVHQQYMVGQSIIFRNMEYEIGEISDDSSVIYLRNENVTFKNSLDTFFLRRYDVRNLEKVGDEGILYRSNSNLAEIRVSHAIADITGENYGFFTLTCDNQTLDFSHGVEGNPWVGEARVSETARKLKGADCLVVTLRARVECNDEMRILISVVFNEFIKTIFPDTYRLLSICPVLASPIENAWDGDKSTDEQIRVLYPYLANSCLKETDDHIMRFIMVNDCADDVGIFDWFYDKKANYMREFLSHIYSYMQWLRICGKPGAYIYFGENKLPACFDLEGCCTVFDGLGLILSDDGETDIETAGNFEVLSRTKRCAFCHRVVESGRYALFDKKRYICVDCFDVVRDRDQLRALVQEVYEYLRKTYPDVVFGQTGFDIDKSYELGEDQVLSENYYRIDYDSRTVYIEKELPVTNARVAILRGIIGMWQYDNQLLIPQSNGQLYFEELYYLRGLGKDESADWIRDALDANTAFVIKDIEDYISGKTEPEETPDDMPDDTDDVGSADEADETDDAGETDEGKEVPETVEPEKSEEEPAGELTEGSRRTSFTYMWEVIAEMQEDEDDEGSDGDYSNDLYDPNKIPRFWKCYLRGEKATDQEDQLSDDDRDLLDDETLDKLAGESDEEDDDSDEKKEETLNDECSGHGEMIFFELTKPNAPFAYEDPAKDAGEENGDEGSESEETPENEETEEGGEPSEVKTKAQLRKEEKERKKRLKAEEKQKKREEKEALKKEKEERKKAKKEAKKKRGKTAEEEPAENPEKTEVPDGTEIPETPESPENPETPENPDNPEETKKPKKPKTEKKSKKAKKPKKGKKNKIFDPDEATNPKIRVYNEFVRHAYAYDRGDISREGVTDAELQSIFAYVIGDWPELFWLSGYSYNTQTFKLTFRCLDENGDVDVRQIKKKIKLLKKGAKEFTKGITRRTKPYDACLKIYRRLILKLDYDGIGLNIRAGEDIGSDDSLRSLYSALVEHKVVCAGYAFAMQYLLQFVGISAAYVSSETAPGNTTHAFNTLRIGKYCYYIDATWGDNSNTMTGETNRGRITYDYFCVPYREFVMTGGNAREYHEPRKEYYTNLEEFKATRHEYFRHNDAYFDRYDEDKLMKLIVRTANEYDEKEMGDFCIAFRAANEQVRDYIVDMLWNRGKLSDIIGRSKEVIKKKKKKALLEGKLIMSAQKGLPTAYFWIMPEKNGRK